ncbi:glycosyltransferase [Novacetimonas hansenii]|uniref:glycosyltransferase n=1 Tax=Novacetimonas hansenii TaxID=436 RepID=UPI0015E8BEC3|nr:glycosyltransferase [Novacetimonas hansenii]
MSNLNIQGNETESVSNSGLQPVSHKPAMPLTFSVVINTNGRLEYLKRTLSGLKYLTYPHFEVCVVAGPTADGTVEYLQSLQGQIKIEHCTEFNLSISRNIGIAMSDGDVVAFIDDDSVPEPEWLADLAKSYTDDSVGAVGGFVYDHTGIEFQARYVTTNRRAYASDWDVPTPHLNFPFSLDVPHLLGTNCSFSRKALLKIGGFDEEYEYFLDETDVCCRINDAGYAIVQRPDAFVHHKYAPSHLRDEKKVIKNWYPLIKNRIYFGMRNGLYHHTVAEVVQAGIDDVNSRGQSVKHGESEGIYTKEDVDRFLEQADKAIIDGLTRGAQPAKYLRDATLEKYHSQFLQYPRLCPVGTRRVICFVTQDYPPGQNGGIARNIAQFARSLAALGHYVHVFTKMRIAPAVDYEDGVWVHRVAINHHELPPVSPLEDCNIPQHIWDYSQTMLQEICNLNEKRKIDVVYCPLWDCEPIAFVLDGTFALIVALQTTMHFWLDSQPLKAMDTEWMRAYGHPIMEMEKFIISHTPLLHANSHAIVRDIEKRYKIKIPQNRVYYSPHGLEDWAAGMPPSDRNDEAFRLLFVGRLASRKGIDVLLKIAPEILHDFPKAILDIVGDDTILRPDMMTYKEEFLALELPVDIRDRVIFHGRVEEDELKKFYRDCDVFIAPSRYESFGLVFLEAMMFGKPVIGCDAGGGPEVITDGVSGFLIKPGDSEGLRSTLEYLLRNPDACKKMGTQARKDYVDRFTDQVMVSDLIKILDNYVPISSPDK